MKFNDLTTKDIAELEQMLQEYRAKLASLRFDMVSKSIQDNSQIRKTRRDIARILTAIGHFQYNSSLVQTPESESTNQ